MSSLTLTGRNVLPFFLGLVLAIGLSAFGLLPFVSSRELDYQQLNDARWAIKTEVSGREAGCFYAFCAENGPNGWAVYCRDEENQGIRYFPVDLEGKLSL